MEQMKNAALTYASWGMSVLPLYGIRNGFCTCYKPDCSNPGKHPLLPNGVKGASGDSKTITDWWTQWPDANVGIVTGAISGVVVIDVDCDPASGKYGDESLIDWEAVHGELPRTWQSLTGGGGRHYFFKCTDPAIRNRTGLLPGIDIRGNGGYVVAPPSMHRSGRRYEWEASCEPEDTPLAPLPPKWTELAGTGPENACARTGIPDIIPAGKRNDTLFWLGCSLRAKGLGYEAIYAALSVENRERCTPPLSNNEIETICHSVARYEQGAIIERNVPYDHSDIGNARKFAEMYRDRLCHVGSWGWTAWTGTRWEQGADHIASKLAMRMADKLLEQAMIHIREAALIEGDEGKAAQERAKKAYTHACRSRSEQRLTAALKLAQSDLYARAEDFNENPYDLNTPAGIVDLRTGAIRAHEPDARCTMITGVSPEQRPSPQFNRFLDTITCGDTELQLYLQQVAGMAMVGKVFTEGLVICHGTGRNGKSTFLNLLARIMGDYACSISPEILMAQRTGQQPQGMAAVRGKRLVISQETEEGQRLSVSAVKQLSSADRIVAKRLYRDPEEFTPTHTLFLATNFLPRVGSTDRGTWRRLIVVPFLHTIPDADVRTDFLETLFAAEAPAVLQWMIEGAVQFIGNNHRLEPPGAVRAASEHYRADENWVEKFLAECCESGPEYREKGGRLYDTYRAWAQEHGEDVRRARDFAAALEAAGYSKEHTRTGTVWVSVRVNPNCKPIISLLTRGP